MLDKDAVLRMVKLYTNIRNEIGQDDYLELTSGLDKKERKKSLFLVSIGLNLAFE